jgi:hypothetical protein
MTSRDCPTIGNRLEDYGVSTGSSEFVAAAQTVMLKDSDLRKMKTLFCKSKVEVHGTIPSYLLLYSIFGISLWGYAAVPLLPPRCATSRVRP